jgi:hypothetical protein
LSEQCDTTLKWLQRTDAAKSELEEEMARLNKLFQKLNISFDDEDEESSGGGAGVYKTKIEDID